MDDLFQTYTGAARRALGLGRRSSSRAAEDESPAAHARAVRAKALDLVRGILPAASLSHMGIYASGQTYEQLVLHLLAHPLAEAQAYGQMLLEELQKIIPSFVVRVPKPDRGGRWIEFLDERREAADGAAARLGLDEPERVRGAVGAAHPRARHRDELLAALLYEAVGDRRGGGAARGRAALRRPSAPRCCASWSATRENRRHRPGRGFETLRYRFEIVSDYGAFRDLQRHRLLTCQWQRLSPDLGADVPHELVRGRPRRRVRTRARRLARRVRAAARRRASSRRRRTRSVSRTASATSSSSTRARRCT